MQGDQTCGECVVFINGWNENRSTMLGKLHVKEFTHPKSYTDCQGAAVYSRCVLIQLATTGQEVTAHACVFPPQVHMHTVYLFVSRRACG